MFAPWKESYDQSKQHIKKQRHYFANKDPSSQSYGFSSSHVWMWELNDKEGWALKNWCFWTVVLEMTLESPLDNEEIQPVHPTGNQSWVVIGRIDAEAETPIIWPPNVKNWLTWKDPDAGKDWRQKEKGTTEDETVGWYHRINGVWVNFGSWWWMGRPDVLQSMGLQRVGHDWTTELNWTELKVTNTNTLIYFFFFYLKNLNCYNLLLTFIEKEYKNISFSSRKDSSSFIYFLFPLYEYSFNIIMIIMTLIYYSANLHLINTYIRV